MLFKKKPNSSDEILSILHPLVKKWFFSKFKDFSLPQLFGVMEIHSRNNILISSPTGSTKTLTAFLSILNELVDSAEKGILKDRVYAIYISPLKALSYDIEINLLKPLEEIEELAGRKLGVRVAARTGDTTQYQRTKMLKNPPHILITTPESLALMEVSPKFSLHLSKVEWIIIDEIHALAENKRGTHLSLSLEHLEFLSPGFCRIGLSATIAPLKEIANFLVGSDRNCQIIDISYLKEMDLKVLTPLSNLIDASYEDMQKAILNLLHKYIQNHKTTLIFTNTRAATERTVDSLKEMFPKFYGDNIGAHHGSLSKESRFSLEDNLRKGNMKVVISSTSLELGIDIGSIDLVILLGSPKSVARALQRIGRSGHKLHAKAKGRIIVTDRDDLVECSVILKAAKEHVIDKIDIPRNSLDVLIQKLMGFLLSSSFEKEDLFKIIKKSYCYSSLLRSDWEEVISLLKGEYASLEERHIYAKVRETDGILYRRGKMTKVIYQSNIGTIPDQTRILVKVGDVPIGSLDEGFLERLRAGDVFVLGGSVYEFRYAKGMVAFVKASVNRPPTVPSWFSEMLPLSFDLALMVGKLRRLVSEKIGSRDEIDFVKDYLYLEEDTAKALVGYFSEQKKFIGIPNDKQILVEHYLDKEQSYYIFHSLFGRRVNDCLSRAIAFIIGRLEHRDVEIGINDNGFYLSAQKKINPMRAFSFLKEEKLELVLNMAIDKSEIFRRRFRHVAGRSQIILRNYKGHKRVGSQQVSSQILISAMKRISNDFIILKETRREILEDLMDIKNAKKILDGIKNSKIHIREVVSTHPSPFAFNLILQGYSDILRMEDRVEFLKRMHQNVVENIEGRDKAAISFKEEIRKRSLTGPQRKILTKLQATNSPLALKLMPSVKRGSFSDSERALISDNQTEILGWDKELVHWLFKEFDYDSFWNDKEEVSRINKDFKINELIRDAVFAARKEDFSRDEADDLVEAIKTGKVSGRLFNVLERIFGGTVAKHWSDRLIKKLKKIMK